MGRTTTCFFSKLMVLTTGYLLTLGVTELRVVSAWYSLCSLRPLAGRVNIFLFRMMLLFSEATTFLGDFEVRRRLEAVAAWYSERRLEQEVSKLCSSR